MPAGFELVDHTADIAIRAWGATPESVFEQVARGMVSLMYDAAAVASRDQRRVVVEAPGRELLLAAWLNELLYLFEADGFVLHDMTVEEVGTQRVTAGLAGEAGGAGRVGARAVVKAATLHDLRVAETDEGWEARVLLDV
jgi:SHS2 domain-containing protein